MYKNAREEVFIFTRFLFSRGHMNRQRIVFARWIIAPLIFRAPEEASFASGLSGEPVDEKFENGTEWRIESFELSTKNKYQGFTVELLRVLEAEGSGNRRRHPCF